MSGLIEVLTGNRNTQPDFVSTDNPVPISAVSFTAGGVPNNFRIASCAATTNASVIATGQHQIYFVIAYNNATSLRFIKFYNTTVTPNPASATPVLSLPIPSGGGIALDLGLAISLFPLGLAVAIVQGAADNDATACVAGDVVGVNVGYA